MPHLCSSFPTKFTSVVLLTLLSFSPALSRQTEETASWKSGAATKAFLSHIVASSPKTSQQALAAKRRLGYVAFLEQDSKTCLVDWKPVFVQTAESPITAAYWPAFVSICEDGGYETDLTEAARAIAANRHVPLFLRASALHTLARTAYRLGRDTEANALWNGMGYIRQWRIIGPFENVSRSGFDRVFGPEQNLSLTQTYSGTEGQSLRWHPAALISHDGTVRLSDSLGGADEEVFYAATAIQSPQGGPVRLSGDIVGASQIFLNGQCVLRDPVYREEQESFADSLSTMVSLKPGWNTLVIKVADSEETHGSFRLRMTDKEGMPLRLTVQPAQVQSGPLSKQGDTPIAQTGAEKELRTYLAAHPKDTEARLWLGVRQRGSGDYEGAMATLRDALSDLPDSGFFHWEYSLALKRNGLTDQAQAEHDTAVHLDDGNVEALLDQDEQQNESLPASEHVRLLKSLAAKHPKADGPLWSLAAAYRSAHLDSDALRTARQAVALNPGEQEQFRLYLLYQLQRRTADAKQQRQKILARYPNNSHLLQAYAENLVENGNPAAITIYRRLLGQNGFDVDLFDTLATLLVNAHDLKGAAAVLDQARQACPQNAGFHISLADIERERGNKNAAIRLYEEAIRLDPSQVSLRDKLQLLSGAKPILSLIPATDTKPIFAHLPKASEYPGVSEVRVLDEGREVVYPDYASVRYDHEIITVLDDASVKRYQQYPIEGSTSTSRGTAEVARILKPDGKVVNCLDNVDGSYVSFPSLAPGDTIDLVYRVEDYPRHGLAGKFWGEWFFSQKGGPVRLSRLAVICPASMELTAREHNGAQPATVRDSGSWRIHEWKESNLPPDQDEPFDVPTRDEARWVDFSTIRSWKEIVAWYQALSGPRCLPDSTLRAKAEELTRGKTTEEDKISAIVDYVSEKIRYQSTPFRMSAFIPTEGKAVLRDSYGDCKDKAALITAMLNAVGVRSHMVLISPRMMGITPYLPGPRFNHAIAVVDTAKGPVWVDGTATGLPFGQLPLQIQDVPALIIDDNTTDLTTSPLLPPDSSVASESTDATLRPDGTLVAQCELSLTGSYGWALRSGFRSISEENRQQVMRTLSAALFENGRTVSSEIVNMDAPTKPLVLKFSMEVPNYAQAAGKLLLVRLPTGGGSAVLSNASVLRSMVANRKQDAEFSMGRGKQTSHVRLTLPDGYIVKEGLTEQKSDSKFGTYRFTSTRNGNVVTADEEMTTLLLRVPAKDLADYVDFAEQGEKIIKTPLILEKQ